MPPGRFDGFRWRPASRPVFRVTHGAAVDILPDVAGGARLQTSDPVKEDLLTSICRLLWLVSYTELFAAELEHNRLLVGRSGSAMLPSSYRARLNGARAEEYDARQRRRERDQLAIELHSNNMQQWSPSLVARSIAYFRLTTSWLHAVETGQRRLASRPTTLKVLRLMRDVRPTPDWMEGVHVFAYAFDQTYEWVGMQKRGRRQALEHVDGRGMPMKISHEVYINSIKIRLPASLSTLSAADLATIAANHGSPYTEDYNHLFTFLRVSVSPLLHIYCHTDVLTTVCTELTHFSVHCGVVWCAATSCARLPG